MCVHGTNSHIFQLLVIKGEKEEMSFKNNLSDGEELGHDESQIQYFLFPSPFQTTHKSQLMLQLPGKPNPRSLLVKIMG